jgi:hypothetical protein
MTIIIPTWLIVFIFINFCIFFITNILTCINNYYISKSNKEWKNTYISQVTKEITELETKFNDEIINYVNFVNEITKDIKTLYSVTIKNDEKK